MKIENTYTYYFGPGVKRIIESYLYIDNNKQWDGQTGNRLLLVDKDISHTDLIENDNTMDCETMYCEDAAKIIDFEIL
jgi:hypothetical protein